jgi:hypothetical protein
MKRKKLNFPVCLVLFSLSVLWLLPNSAMAEGDGGWTTTSAPGYIFQIEEDLLNNQNYMFMTVLKPDLDGTEIYFGPASGSVGSTYLLEPWKADSDMMATWQFNSDIQATMTVESCSTNCLWQAGQVVTLNKIFGDNQNSQTGERYGGCTCSGTMSGTRWCDNGNGTVTDLTTCLVWLKIAYWGNLKQWREEGDYDHNDDAHTRAGILKAGTSGADLSDGSVEGDWRLPTKIELDGLAHGTEAVRSGSMQAFTGVQDYSYWSSTTYGSRTDLAWSVDIEDGRVHVGGKTNFYFVWPVRPGR